MAGTVKDASKGRAMKKGRMRMLISSMIWSEEEVWN
jgi:hypothetical protein